MAERVAVLPPIFPYALEGVLLDFPDSLSRPATAQPAEPAPVTMKS